jgi:hypothetical protein
VSVSAAATFRSARRRAVVAWVVALALGWWAIAALGLGSRDADSRLYAQMAAELSRRPAAEWIAPLFPPGWFMSGPFREHPAGLFAPAALLARLGYPAGKAAYATNALYQVLTLAVLPALAAAFATRREARSLGWLLQLLPIAFAYRVRANQEPALVLCLLVALLGVERSRRSAGWAALTAAGLVGALLVKGVFAVFGPALCALWLFARREPSDGHAAKAWMGLAVAVALAFGAAALYDALYRRVTGEAFWAVYLTRQLGVAAAAEPGGGAARAIVQKLSNLLWYSGRVVWFAFPWCLFLLAGPVRAWRRRREPSSSVAPAPAAAAGATMFVVGATVLYLVAFGLADRRADRYIFPLYYLVGAAGAVTALRRWSGLARVAGQLDRPWVPAALWCATLFAQPLAGLAGLPIVKIGAPGP